MTAIFAIIAKPSYRNNRNLKIPVLPNTTSQYYVLSTCNATIYTSNETNQGIFVCGACSDLFYNSEMLYKRILVN